MDSLQLANGIHTTVLKKSSDWSPIGTDFDLRTGQPAVLSWANVVVHYGNATLYDADISHQGR